MSTENKKCVIIIDDSLPPWRHRQHRGHMGIILFPVPILKGSRENLRALRDRLFSAEYAGLTVVDFFSLAQGCRTYDEFISKMSACPEEKLTYAGIAICGSKKIVNKLTGSMPLLR